MAIPQDQELPSFSCELRIIQAQNVEFKSIGNLFVRLYLSAGNNKRIQLNSRKISPTTSAPFWNESFSLDCFSTQHFLETLKKESVVLELRQGKVTPVLGKILGSRLLCRAEIPWKTVLESPKKEFEKWIKMDLASKSAWKGVKAPKLQVEMKVQAAEIEKRRSRNIKKWDQCGCRQGHDDYCITQDYDIFAIAAALEAL